MVHCFHTTAISQKCLLRSEAPEQTFDFTGKESFINTPSVLQPMINSSIGEMHPQIGTAEAPLYKPRPWLFHRVRNRTEVLLCYVVACARSGNPSAARKDRCSALLVWWLDHTPQCYQWRRVTNPRLTFQSCNSTADRSNTPTPTQTAFRRMYSELRLL